MAYHDTPVLSSFVICQKAKSPLASLATVLCPNTPGDARMSGKTQAWLSFLFMSIYPRTLGFQYHSLPTTCLSLYNYIVCLYSSIVLPVLGRTHARPIGLGWNIVTVCVS